MCGCGRTNRKFNSTRRTIQATSQPKAVPPVELKTNGMSQERRALEKRRRQIIKNNFGK